MAIISILASLAAFYILGKLILRYIQTRQFTAFALAKNCGPPIDVSDPWPYIGRIRRIMRMKESGEDFMDDIVGGDFRNGQNTIQLRLVDGSRAIQTVEPANLQAILATQFADFETGRQDIFWPVLGKGIFSSDGPAWEHSRALMRPQFARANLNDLEATERNVEILLQAIERSGIDGWTGEVDLMPLLYNFTLDTATEFLFGESVGAQAGGIERAGMSKLGTKDMKNTTQTAGQQASSLEFKEDFELMSEYLLTRLRFQSLYWLGDGFKFRKAIRNAKNVVEHFVDRAVDASKEPKRPDDKYNFLSELALQTQNKDELRDQTMSLLLAGRDTTASLLAWCYIRLALHPEIYSKLRSAVLADFEPGRPVDFAKLKACRYLQHFLHEVLRLHPTVPVNARKALRNTTIPVGGGPDQKQPVAVRKGESVAFSVYVMHRRKDLWGEDALEFKPERWENKKMTAWQYLPFLGGPRICIGQQFALTEASYVLMKLLQRYDKVEPVDAVEMKKMKKTLGLTMAPASGVHLMFHRA